MKKIEEKDGLIDDLKKTAIALAAEQVLKTELEEKEKVETEERIKSLE